MRLKLLKKISDKQYVVIQMGIRLVNVGYLFLTKSIKVKDF